LTEVNLSDTILKRPEPEAVQVLKMFSSALEGSDLSYLNLSNNALGDKGVRAFGDLLNSQSNLVELHLMNAGISPDAAKAICELLPSTNKLKVLHFHHNMSGDDGGNRPFSTYKRIFQSRGYQHSSPHPNNLTKNPITMEGLLSKFARESSKLMVEVAKRGSRPKEDREIEPELVTDHIFDISGRRRAFIDAEEAKELLKPLKEPFITKSSFFFTFDK
nr:hypothetical protein [Tanacetum cinerariifolium]